VIRWIVVIPVKFAEMGGREGQSGATGWSILSSDDSVAADINPGLNGIVE